MSKYRVNFNEKRHSVDVIFTEFLLSNIQGQKGLKFVKVGMVIFIDIDYRDVDLILVVRGV